MAKVIHGDIKVDVFSATVASIRRVMAKTLGLTANSVASIDGKRVNEMTTVAGHQILEFVTPRKTGKIIHIDHTVIIVEDNQQTSITAKQARLILNNLDEMELATFQAELHLDKQTNTLKKIKEIEAEIAKLKSEL